MDEVEQRSCVLVCRECSDDVDLMVVPFYSQADRGRWAAEHRRGTGHDRWFCVDGWPTPEEVAQLIARRDETAVVLATLVEGWPTPEDVAQFIAGCPRG